jgi:hypothetical protein
MSDRELTTRDLAGQSEAEASDAETPTPADEPLSRDRSEGDRESAASTSEGTTSAADGGPLFPEDESERLRERWLEIQRGFVDQPRESVEQADALVADLMQRLAASFANERQGLEAQWDRGDDVSTEELRVALTRYRSFFDRLLSA